MHVAAPQSTLPERPPRRERPARRAGDAHGDSHALAIAAEAFMNIVQWDYHATDAAGAPALRPEAAEAERLLAAALALDPANPLAHHLTIHLTEAASPHP